VQDIRRTSREGWYATDAGGSYKGSNGEENGDPHHISIHGWTVICTGEELAGVEVTSVDVAVKECCPADSPVDGVHDQAPLSEAVAVHIAAPSASTVTVASGSAVPDTVGVGVATVAPEAGEVIWTGGGKSVIVGTPSPEIETTTLWTVTCPPPFRSRKSALECCAPPKYAPEALTVAVFHVLLPLSGMLAVERYGSAEPSSYWTENDPLPWS
jgi:hypothetical protein